MDRKTLLEVNKLEVVYFREIMAIQGVTVKVPEGSIVAILGVNGAGKSTTLRAISGFLGLDNAEISDGTIEYEGMKLKRNIAPHETARKGIILIPERDKVFATITVEENLMSPQPSGRRNFTVENVYSYFPVLKERRRQIAGYLSGGERQMLAIGQALLCQPKLLLVDELSLGLAPAIVTELMGTLGKLRKDLGITILLVEQNAAASLKIADYGYIMENGRVVFDGTTEKLMSHEDVKEFYLGFDDKGMKNYKDVKQYRRTRRWWG